MSKSAKNILKTPLYGNCRVENPNGVHIFNCGHKKAQWYIKRDLASKISENPFIIRLTFTPNGPGHANDDFYLQKRQNICVSCGCSDQLTRHHVVPFMYRRFFPEHLKNHSSYDILPLCFDCHEKYEEYAQQFKKQIAEELSTPKNIVTLDVESKDACKAASALLTYGTKLPSARYDYLMNVVKNYYAVRGKINITIADIESAARLRYYTHKTNKLEGETVVESIDNIELFVKRWREHFITTLAPKFLPPYWRVDRSL